MSSPHPSVERLSEVSSGERIGIDSLALTKVLSSISLSICHVQELVGLAYQLSCEIHPSDPPQAVLRVSGRLATLMHVSEEQLRFAQVAAQRLIEAFERRGA